MKIAALLLGGLVTLGVGVASGGALVLLRSLTPKVRLNRKQAPVQNVLPNKPVNVLLLGSDTRTGLDPNLAKHVGPDSDVEGRRSDTMILIHIDPRRQHALLVHFPRDLLVDIPGHGQDKINSAYQVGGPRLVVRTVQQLTRLPINHYIEIDFQGFVDVVDALGRVRLCVSRPLIDHVAGLFLKHAGCYALGGQKALAFVRARHVEGDTIPDFARISRQQQFIRAVLNRLLRVSSLAKAPQLVRAFTHNVTTDESLKPSDLVLLLNELRQLSTTDSKGARNLDLRAVPSTPQTIDGIDYVTEVQPDADRLFRALRTGGPLGTLGVVLPGTSITPAVVRVRVLSAGVDSRADDVARALRKGGYAVLGEGEAPARLGKRSAILYGPGKKDRADVVNDLLDLPLERVSRRLLHGADVLVVIRGQDVGEHSRLKRRHTNGR